MYQQKAQRQGNSAKLDFVLLLIFILVVLFARQAATFAAALPAPFNTLVQIFLLGAIIAALLWVYAYAPSVTALFMTPPPMRRAKKMRNRCRIKKARSFSSAWWQTRAK